MPIETLVQGRLTEQFQNVVAGYFEIDNLGFDVPFFTSKHAVRLSGHFLGPTEPAYDIIAERAKADDFLIFFRQEDDEQVIYAVPGKMPIHKRNWPLAGILFVATVISVFLTFGLTADLEIDWASGLGYAIPLMSILLAHELGHFFVARHHDMVVSPPFFIPLPIIGLGTLGAVIAMLAPPKNRRQLLQMGAAGPLAGLALAIPILLYGLSISEVGPMPTGQPYMLEGNSLLYIGLKWLHFGQVLPTSNGLDVSLHPIAFAGWVGLLVTALNLIPAGQLDGGHAVFTLFGERVRPLTMILIATLVGLAVWTQFWGWLLWAVLLFVFGQRYAVPMDDLTPMEMKYKVLALFMLVLAVLLFMPIPLQIIEP